MGKQTKSPAPKPGQPPVPPAAAGAAPQPSPVVPGDEKPHLFLVTPTPPYKQGDLWQKGDKVYISGYHRDETEPFSADDWTERDIQDNAPSSDPQPPVIDTPTNTPQEPQKSAEIKESKENFQDVVDDAILKKILTGLPVEQFNTAYLSGRFDSIVMPHQKFLLENYFARDGVKYTEGMARIFAKYGNPEQGYEKLNTLYKKLNK